MSSRTRPASACPRISFITAPISAPAAATLPSRILSATSGLAAIALSTAAEIETVSLRAASGRSIGALLPRGPRRTTNIVEFYYPEEIALFELNAPLVMAMLSAFEAGLRKILARMGISTMASYIGGLLFEFYTGQNAQQS